MSKSSIYAAIHFSIRKISLLCFGSDNPLGFEPPHPRTREKSFPVPKGIIPRGTFEKST